jgi:hypothetical protein
MAMLDPFYWEKSKNMLRGDSNKEAAEKRTGCFFSVCQEEKRMVIFEHFWHENNQEIEVI